MTKELSQRSPVGWELLRFRESKNLTQKEFAAVLGYSYGYVGDVERGKTEPSRKYLQALKKFFDLSIDRLLELGDMDKKDNFFPEIITMTRICDCGWELIGICTIQKEKKLPKKYMAICANPRCYKSSSIEDTEELAINSWNRIGAI